MANMVPEREVDRTIDELIAREPRALAVLNRFGVHTCCGGAATLAEAARRDGFDLNELLAALHDALHPA